MATSQLITERVSQNDNMLFKKYRRQNNFVKLLTDHLQNVQIQPGEELARQYKTIVSNDQCYVSIKLEEEDDDEDIWNMPTRCQREVVFLWGCKIVKVLQNICNNSTTSLVMSKLLLQLVVSHGDGFYRIEYDENDDFLLRHSVDQLNIIFHTTDLLILRSIEEIPLSN